MNIYQTITDLIGRTPLLELRYIEEKYQANAKIIAKGLGYKEAQYRKVLTSLRGYIKIIENNLRNMDYSFDYSDDPSA